MKCHKHGVVEMGHEEHKCFLIGVYGHPEPSWCLETWSLIKSIKNSEDRPWMVFDDFNEVLEFSENGEVGIDRRNKWRLLLNCYWM